MICERCEQEIEDGELYHRAHRASRGVLDGVAMPSVVGEVIVHDFPCPTRYEIRDGHIFVNGADIGPESMYSTSHPAINATWTAAALQDLLGQ